MMTTMYKWGNKEWLAFIFGLLCCIELRILGVIYLSELIALPFCVLIGYRDMFSNKYTRRILVLCILWLIGLFIADQYNDTELSKALKGEFTIVLLILESSVVFWLIKDKIQRVLCFFLGYSLSGLIHFYVFGQFDSLQAMDIWRVYAWESFTLCLGAYCYLKGKKMLAVIITEAFAIWTLFHGSRHVFLTVSIANVLIFFFNRSQQYNIYRSIISYRKKTLLMLLFLGVTLYSTIAFYEYTASHGILGPQAQEKYLEQKNTSAGLASGRVAFLIGLSAVKENPIIGYGSFAQDTRGFAINYLLQNNYDIQSSFVFNDDGLIPSHSYLVSSWVYAGILGALFWFYIIILILKAIRKGVFIVHPDLIAMAVYITLPLLWDILFSPFSYRLRFLFYIAMVTNYLTTWDRLRSTR